MKIPLRCTWLLLAVKASEDRTKLGDFEHLTRPCAPRTVISAAREPLVGDGLSGGCIATWEALSSLFAVTDAQMTASRACPARVSRRTRGLA